jgi:bacterioferritin (cytochrome b1)
MVNQKSIDELLYSQNNPAKASDNDEVVALLKESLIIHWEQTRVLTAQAEHLARWQYTKLAKTIKEDALQEHEHATINLTRLEFFDADAQPLVVAPPVWKRHDMVAMLEYNLESVQKAARTERKTILAARAIGDEITANIMLPLLQGSEDGIILYSGFLKVIQEIGLDNFAANMM